MKKTVLITGGSDGLGRELGKLCVEKGYEVVVLSRQKPDYSCIHIKTDLSNEEDIMNAATTINNEYSKFDALVNCAGVFSEQELKAINYEEAENVFKVNVLAPIFLTSMLIENIKSNGADILNVGSTSGTKAYESQCAYGASKWALRGASLNLQLELKNTKCRVMQFNPGGMNTKLFKKYNGKDLSFQDKLMNPRGVAELMLYILELPKRLEVSELLLNRK